MSFAKIVQEDRRLMVLLLLKESDQYSANEHLLRRALDNFGHNVGKDLLRTELAWLSEQGLLKTTATADVVVAKLTSRGLDVADGRALIPGIKVPEPGE